MCPKPFFMGKKVKENFFPTGSREDRSWREDGKVDICSKNVLTILCHIFTLSFIQDKEHIETWQKKSLTC